MRINKSPWIYQLDRDRKYDQLKKDIDTDVVIVGAGIAGISTAFFLLKYTNKRVVLCDKNKPAHGATGHNAGQVLAGFERPLTDMVKEFGFDKVKRALHDLHSAWNLIDEMYRDAKLKILFSKVHGVVGYSNLHQVISSLNDLEIRILAGLDKDKFFISDTAPFLKLIPNNLKHLYKVLPSKDILKSLETEDNEFHAVMVDQRACMNSALFCQDILEYLLNKFSSKFSFYENTNVLKIVLNRQHAILDAGKHTIGAEKVVLCTNGFENFDIFNDGGLAIDKKFHHLVNGTVGYMSGYLEEINKDPTAIVYFTEYVDYKKSDPYFYLTRRSHELGNKKHNLICVGGSEVIINDREEYLNDFDYPDKMHKEIDDFINKVYNSNPNKKIEYEFTWHGLMGYTPNRVRLIGEEPKNPVLLYNLGCNGIGIVPSIFGGRKISRIIGGENLNDSIFDPQG